MSHEARVGANTREATKYQALDSDRLGFKSSFASCVIMGELLNFPTVQGPSLQKDTTTPTSGGCREAQVRACIGKHGAQWAYCFLTFSPHGTWKTLPHIRHLCLFIYLLRC